MYYDRYSSMWHRAHCGFWIIDSCLSWFYTNFYQGNKNSEPTGTPHSGVPLRHYSLFSYRSVRMKWLACGLLYLSRSWTLYVYMYCMSTFVHTVLGPVGLMSQCRKVRWRMSWLRAKKAKLFHFNFMFHSHTVIHNIIICAQLLQTPQQLQYLYWRLASVTL